MADRVPIGNVKHVVTMADTNTDKYWNRNNSYLIFQNLFQSKIRIVANLTKYTTSPHL